MIREIGHPDLAGIPDSGNRESRFGRDRENKPRCPGIGDFGVWTKLGSTRLGRQTLGWKLTSGLLPTLAATPRTPRRRGVGPGAGVLQVLAQRRPWCQCRPRLDSCQHVDAGGGGSTHSEPQLEAPFLGRHWPEGTAARAESSAGRGRGPRATTEERRDRRKRDSDLKPAVVQPHYSA
jgi:hypothetical protein